MTTSVIDSDTGPTALDATQSVSPRADALADAGMLRLVDASAVKENAFAS